MQFRIMELMLSHNPDLMLQDYFIKDLTLFHVSGKVRNERICMLRDIHTGELNYLALGRFCHGLRTSNFHEYFMARLILILMER